MAKTPAQIKAEEEAFRKTQEELNAKPLPVDSLDTSLNRQLETSRSQAAADKAHQEEPVMLRDPNLPPEAQAFTNPQALVADKSRSPAAQTSGFVDPNQSASQQQDSVSMVAAAPQAPASAAPGVPDNSGEINKQFSAAENAAQDVQSQIDKLNAERTAAIEKHMADDEKNVEQVKPTDIFAGKNTWQKILGGVGMFLGSLNPEGAKNIANMIDKEITRDQQMQLNNIKLKQDKNDKHYQNLLQKYGSQEAAMLAKKKDAYSVLDIHLKKLELSARNAETRARLAQGREELELKKQSLNQDLMKASLKAQQEAGKGAIPGYQGSITDPTAAREFRGQVTAANQAFPEIDNLLKINKKGISSAFSPADRASAEQSQTLLLGQLREVLVGPGTVSDGERALMKDAIANPTNFFSLGSSNELKLNKLKQAIRNKIDANARSYGLSKQLPPGAQRA